MALEGREGRRNGVSDHLHLLGLEVLHLEPSADVIVDVGQSVQLEQKEKSFFGVCVGFLALQKDIQLVDALGDDEQLGVGLAKVLNVEMLHVVPGIKRVHLVLSHHPVGELEASPLKQEVRPKLKDLLQALKLQQLVGVLSQASLTLYGLDLDPLAGHCLLLLLALHLRLQQVK